MAHSLPAAMSIVSAYVIGVAVWGNEADYWRFGKPGTIKCAVPLLVALFIGQVLFPCTGFLVAYINGIRDTFVAASFLTKYSFCGLTIVGATVLGASWFAANDSVLFGSTSAAQTLKPMRHRYCVLLFAIAGTLVAAALCITGTAKSLEYIASLNAIVLPTPTVIMVAEYFLVLRIFGKQSDRFLSTELGGPTVRWSAIVSLCLGIFIGIITSGMVPGLQSLQFGICSLQAWFVALTSYLLMRSMELKRS